MKQRQGTDLRAVVAFLRQLPLASRIALGVLAVVGLLAAGGLPYAFGLVEDAERELRRLRSATAQTQGQARQAAMDYDYVVANADRYKDALARGVLEAQDRLHARARLDELMTDTYLVRLAYEMAAVKAQQGPDGHEILTTPISMEVSAMLDRDVFGLLRAVENAFPGYGVVRSFRLTRGEAVDEAALKSVAAGSPVPFITGQVSLDWRTARKAGAEGAR